MNGASVGGEDGVGVVGAVLVDVIDGGVDRIDDFYAYGEGEVFGVPVLGRGGLCGGVEVAGGFVGADFDLFGGESFADGFEEVGGVLVKEEVFDGVADCAAGVAGLGVDADVCDELFDAAGGAVDVDVAVTGVVFEDGDGGLGDDGADEGFAAAGDDEVDVLIEFEDEGDEGAVSGFDELDGVGEG